MLTHLSVKNLAIVEEASAVFGAGLNIITGETGAGKSVLMGALELVLGGRANKSAIRDGALEATVEALFSLSDTTVLDACLAESGLPPCEEGSLLIRRIVSASGTGRCLVNDAATVLQTLRKLGCLLVDIHGPYDHQSLLDSQFQRQVLDAYGHCASLLSEYDAVWRTLRTLQQKLNDLQGDTSNVAEEIDRLQFIVDEITSASLTEADEEPLIQEHAAAANAEQILTLGSAVTQALTEGDASAFDLLVATQHHLTELAHILPIAETWKTETQNVATQLQELSRTLNDRLSQIDADPEHLQHLEERMALVQRLKRKYGSTITRILETCTRHQMRLSDLATRTEQVMKLTQEIDANARLLTEKAERLSHARSRAGAKLAKAITLELRDLGFLKSEFSITLSPIPPECHGMDEICFGFAPNPGEPLRPLKAIASSGEIARVMLAVKAVLASHDSIPVLVFDEIDSNIGGEVGRAVGQKLRHVAETHQVISITHLPQSAVYGQHHFVVTKDVVKGRTRTRIEQLDDAGRIDEIARMLGGKGLTSVIESHARELLASAARK